MKQYMIFILALLGAIAGYFITPAGTFGEYSQGIGASIGIVIGFVIGLVINRK